mgnify:CR=1 FL=1
MNLSLDPAAKKALSLRKDAVFRLLVLMMVLLGWLASMGAAGLAMFESVYSQWQLAQKNHVSIYLMPDSPPEEIRQLEEELLALEGVSDITPLSQENVRQLVAPYIGDRTALPLPKILDVRVSLLLNRLAFEEEVYQTFPQAEIEDAREMLQRVSEGVRFVQVGAIAIALVAFVVLAFLVSFTVRSGLKAQQQALNIMQYIGATNQFVTTLVLQQVWGRAFVGGLMAAGLSVICLLTLQWLQPGVEAYMTPMVWGAALALPLLLVLVVMLAACRGVSKGLKETGA